MKRIRFTGARRRLVPSLALLGFVGVALAGTLPGLPKTISDYATWNQVAKNLDTGGPHSGKDKVVFANPVAAKAWKTAVALPEGSVVVKTAGQVNKPDFVAVMSKTKQGWRYEEYFPKNGSYSIALSGAVCQGCHEGAKDKDFLFTR